MISQGTDKLWKITKDGELVLNGSIECPTTFEAILTEWKPKFVGGERRMLDTLISVYPYAISRTKLGEAVGISSGSGSFSNYTSHLKTSGLVVRVSEGYKASENLFIFGGPRP